MTPEQRDRAVHPKIEPVPTSGESPCAVANAVARDTIDRATFGEKKYGMTLDTNPADACGMRVHAYYEALDLAAYIRADIERDRRALNNRADCEAKLFDIVKDIKGSQPELAERIRRIALALGTGATP